MYFNTSNVNNQLVLPTPTSPVSNSFQYIKC